MTVHENLLGPEPTYLPERAEPTAELDRGGDPTEVAKRHPDFSAAWATLAEGALERGEVIAAYAYARTGYHRGLDQLRGAGWKGFGAVPFAHEPNQGFLRAVAVLARAANQIGEVDEYRRCLQMVMESDPEALDALGLR
jgi:hypothetical protein